MTTSPAPIPRRHASHPLIVVIACVLVAAAMAIVIVLAARNGSTGTSSSTGLSGSGVPAAQTRTVPAFTAVDLAGSNVVTVDVGGAQTVTVHGDDNLIGYVTTTVRNGTLAVGQRRDFRTTSPMSVTITVPSLDAVTLSGSGVLTVDGAKAGHFTIRAPGSGVLVVNGTTTTLDASLAGTGDVRLDGLAAHDATATVAGTGRLLVNASQSLDATVSGTGAIVYTGNPAKVTKNVTGTGTITGQ
jgi:hypothetical protein